MSLLGGGQQRTGGARQIERGGGEVGWRRDGRPAACVGSGAAVDEEQKRRAPSRGGTAFVATSVRSEAVGCC